MRIDSVRAFYLRAPDVRDIGDGSQDALLIRVTGGGFIGWGECEASPLPTIAALVAPLSHSACHPVLDSVLGAEVSGPEDIYQIHRNVKVRSADLHQADHALSGIDIALWDLLGKRHVCPVWSFFTNNPVPKMAYASQLFGDTSEETYAAAKRLRNTNFRAAKFGWGPIGIGSLREDREQLAAAKEGLGANILLMVDTGCVFGHDLSVASTLVPLLQEFEAVWWEEPFAPGALAEYGELSKIAKTPLAAGEGAHTADQAKHFIDYGGVSFVQVDAGRIGGITSAREVAVYAKSKGVQYVNHTFTTNLALSASLQPYADLEGYAEVPVAANPIASAVGGPIRGPDSDGFIHLSTSSGLGVDVDPNAFRRYLQDIGITWNGQVIWPMPP